MLFKKFRSVPANTTSEAPDWQKLTVCKGTIKQWIIFFDPEAANLLHVRIEHHHVQIMPFSGSEWIVGFHSDTPFEDNIKIDDPPYVLDIFAYNEDDTNPHEYYIHPIIIPTEPYRITEPGLIEKITKFFGGP